MRAQSATASSVAIIRARQAIRASDSGARIKASELQPAKRRRAERSGNAAAISRRSRHGVSARNSGPRRIRQARVDLVSASQMPAGPGRRRENESRGAIGMRRGETKRDEAAERDAAHDRAFDPAAIERRPAPAPHSSRSRGSRRSAKSADGSSQSGNVMTRKAVDKASTAG